MQCVNLAEKAVNLCIYLISRLPDHSQWLNSMQCNGSIQWKLLLCEMVEICSSIILKMTACQPLQRSNSIVPNWHYSISILYYIIVYWLWYHWLLKVIIWLWKKIIIILFVNVLFELIMIIYLTMTMIYSLRDEIFKVIPFYLLKWLAVISHWNLILLINIPWNSLRYSLLSWLSVHVILPFCWWSDDAEALMPVEKSWNRYCWWLAAWNDIINGAHLANGISI